MFKLIKRNEITRFTGFKIRLISVVLSLIAISIFLAILKYNPLEVFAGMIKGSFGSPYRIRQTIIVAIPLAITAAGVSVAFKMKFWNIGGEGQIFLGAFGAALVALKMPNLPGPIMIILMAVLSMLFGGLYSLIAGILKVYFRTNETIVTLMLNYIALKFITYLQYGPWKDKKALGFPKIPNFPDKAILPNVLGIHGGWIIAVIVLTSIYIFLKNSKKGYEIAVLGESENTARYAGIDIKKTMLTAVFLSGALCGLTGFVQSSAVSQTLSVEVTGGAGYSAIIVAWVSNLSIPGIFASSILFAALYEGSSFIQTAFGIPSAAASVLQAFILFFVLGGEIFIKYKLVFGKRRA